MPSMKALTLLLLCVLLFGCSAVSSSATPSTVIVPDNLFPYASAPQVAAFSDSQTVVVVFEASATTMGAGDQFIGLTCSPDAGTSWLASPMQVKVGATDRPMWKPTVTLQVLNASVGVVFVYFSQNTGEDDAGNAAYGDIYQTWAIIGLSGSSTNCSLGSATWAPAELVWATFGGQFGNPQVTTAVPSGWWDEQPVHTAPLALPASWMLAISQVPRNQSQSGSPYATLFVSTDNGGANWTLLASVFNATNDEDAFSRAQLIGSIELPPASSSSSGSSGSSSSSSGADEGPRSNLAATLVNRHHQVLATTSSADAGASWSILSILDPLFPLENMNLPGSCSGAVNFSRPTASAAYYSASHPLIAFFGNNSGDDGLLALRQVGSSECVLQIDVGPGVSAIGLSPQAVWLKPRPVTFFVVSSNMTSVRFSKIAFNEVAAEALDSSAAIAITFCIVGGVYAVIVAVFLVGRFRAKQGEAYFFVERPPSSVGVDRKSLRRSVNEHTILV